MTLDGQPLPEGSIIFVGDGGGHYEGEAILESFSVESERRQLATVELSIVFDGAVTWADAAA